MVSRRSKVATEFQQEVEYNRHLDTLQEGRHLSPETIKTISETLGAINTVGKYLVNYTRGADDPVNNVINLTKFNTSLVIVSV